MGLGGCKVLFMLQEERKKELTEALTIMETKARKRSLGNIRFIGELFKLKVRIFRFDS